MARVFFLKSTPSNMWVMCVYIVWVKTCSRYAEIEKQNVLRVSCGKVLPAKYLQKPAVGPKNLATPAYFVLGPRPASWREKCPRTYGESPNGLEMLPRMILSSAF